VPFPCWAISDPHARRILCRCFDAQEEALLGGAESGTVKLWDLEKGKALRTLLGHRSECLAVDFHPYGAFFASGSLDTNLKAPPPQTLRRPCGISSCARTRGRVDGAESGGVAQVWDVRRKTCIQTYKGHMQVRARRPHPILDAAASTALGHEGDGGAQGVSLVKFSPDGRWVISGGEEGIVKARPPPAARFPCAPPARRAPLTGGRGGSGVGPDGREAALRLPARRRCHGPLRPPRLAPALPAAAHGSNRSNRSNGVIGVIGGCGAQALDLHPSELLLASGAADRSVRLTDLDALAPAGAAAAEGGGVLGCVFSADGEALLSVSGDYLKASPAPAHVLLRPPRPRLRRSPARLTLAIAAAAGARCGATSRRWRARTRSRSAGRASTTSPSTPPTSSSPAPPLTPSSRSAAPPPRPAPRARCCSCTGV
jgi:hypothetical protein